MKQAKIKKNLKNTQKFKKKLFYFKFKFNSNIIFYLKNCSCKSNLKYLIQLDNKFDSSFRVIRTFINSVQYINKNHKKKNYFFSRKIAKKNGSLRSFKIKNSEILAFSNFIFTEFNLHANKPLLHFLLYFFHFNAKSTSYKSKNKSYTFANSQRQSLLSSFNQISLLS